MPTDRGTGTTATRNFYLQATALGAMFVVAVGAWVLLAMGVLKQGVTGPVVIGFYVFLGVFVALMTFRVLRSYAKVRGRPYGVAVEIGGPFAGVILIVACGVAAEIHRPQPPFNFTLQLVPAPDGTVAGRVGLNLGPRKETVQIVENRAEFREIEDKFNETDVTVILDAPGWSAKAKTVKVARSATVDFTVDAVTGFCDPKAAGEKQNRTHEALVGRIPSFVTVGKVHVGESVTGDSLPKGPSYRASLEALSRAHEYAQELEALPACLDELHQAERFADAAYAWTMAGLYSRSGLNDPEAASDRLTKAETALEKARAVLERMANDEVKQRAAARSLPTRVKQYEAYRLAILDAVQHKGRIMELRNSVGEDANSWAIDPVLEPLFQRMATQ